MKGVKKYLILAVAFVQTNLPAQELRRLGGIGLGLKPINDSIAKLNQLKKGEGLLVVKVVPELTGASMQVKEGDIVLSINGITDLTLPGFNVNKRFTKYEGDELEIIVLRNGHEIKLKGKAIARPYEKSKDFDIKYEQFEFRGGRVRCIVSSPKVGRQLPGILLIQGYTCGSIDNPSPNNPSKKLADELTKRGYIVMRAEKPGVGDCYGTPDCYDIDFRTEVECFKNAYLKLKSLANVDTSNLFILGHSMGGMEAPFIASEVKPKGVIVYGVTTKSWYEYLIEMLRYQNPNFGVPYEKVQTEMNIYYRLLYELLVKSKKPGELVKGNKEYLRLLKRDFNYIKGNDFLTRDVVFSQSLYKEDVLSEWAKVSCYVLSAFGEYDIQAINDFGHKEIVEVVNEKNPGKATFVSFPRTEHGMIELNEGHDKWSFHLDPAKAQKVYSKPINKDVLDSYDSWMKKLINR